MAHKDFQSCIDACIRCAEACEHCHAACLEEDDLKMMAGCLRLDKDCAQLCWTAVAFMSRDSAYAADICRICGDVCEACGNECRQHEHDHCQQCADECESCIQECRQIAGAVSR